MVVKVINSVFKRQICSYGYFTGFLAALLGYLKTNRYRRLFDLMGGKKTLNAHYFPTSICVYFTSVFFSTSRACHWLFGLVVTKPTLAYYNPKSIAS